MVPLAAGVALLRVYSLWNGPRADPGPAAIASAQPDGEDLPLYSILVPLFREDKIVPDLIIALEALDYPSEKLQVLLVLEEADATTQQTLQRVRLPQHFDVVIVPAGEPQTKPRALNYALPCTTGDYVTVYDAEDVPEPDQLKRALAAFQSGPANLVCVQAKLNIYNASRNWLTRQFAIEYSVLFDWLLPALQALGLPVPLGGTSNHFRGLR